MFLLVFLQEALFVLIFQALRELRAFAVNLFLFSPLFGHCEGASRPRQSRAPGMFDSLEVKVLYPT